METKWLETGNMLGDMGSKALPENPFVRFRDSMNGYALVRAKFPQKVMSPYIYNGSPTKNTLPQAQAMLMKFEFSEDVDSDGEFEEEDDNNRDDDVESEEEEDEDDNVNGLVVTINEPDLDVAAAEPVPEP